MAIKNPNFIQGKKPFYGPPDSFKNAPGYKSKGKKGGTLVKPKKIKKTAEAFSYDSRAV